MSKKILYIQHAPRIGGSVISLKELVIDSVQHNIECYVICVNTEVSSYYKAIGVKTYVLPLASFNHNSAFSYKLKLTHLLHFIKQIIKFLISLIYLVKICSTVKPQIVHLNSSTLIPYSLLFKILRKGTIVHIREYVVNGCWGVRKKLLRFILNGFADQVFYISEIEYRNLKTKKEKSVVVYNYIHTKDFWCPIKKTVRLNSKYTLITLGGIYKIKGGDVLLEALKLLSDEFELLVVGSSDPRDEIYDLLEVDGEIYHSRVMSLLSEECVSKKVKFIGRVSNPNVFLAKADALIFWTTSPHFPRPVFEGFLQKLPIIYYNPGFDNRYINAQTVNTIEGPEVHQLKDAIEEVFRSQEALERKIEAGYKLANQVFTENNFEIISRSYNKVFNKYGLYI